MTDERMATSGEVEKLLKDESLTFAEKTLTLKRVDEPMKPAIANDIIVAAADFTMATDGTGPLAIRVLQEMGAKRVWDPSKVLLVIDHTYPAASEQIASLHHLMREFAKEQGVAVHEGSICHQLILEEHSVPGMLFIGADSHSTMNGCVAAFCSGVGSTDMAALWVSGRTWLRVPESIRIKVDGELRRGVYAKDIVLTVCGMLTTEGANYKAVEYTGDAVRRLSMSSRATLCNMGMEIGAKAAIVEPDEVTRDYMKLVGRQPILEVHAGKEASYTRGVELDAGQLEPTVSAPSSPDNAKHIREVEGTPFDQAFLGSCTNARLEDLEVAASIVEGHRVKPGVRFIVTPASKAVFYEAMKRGLFDIFMQAGAVVTGSTCGACVGTHCGVLGSGEVCISSSNRNYIGRMGARESKVYLASPATVAASAIEGVITDPRKHLPA